MTLRDDICGSARQREKSVIFDSCGLVVSSELLAAMNAAEYSRVNKIHQRHHDQGHNQPCVILFSSNDDGSTSAGCRDCWE